MDITAHPTPNQPPPPLLHATCAATSQPYISAATGSSRQHGPRAPTRPPIAAASSATSGPGGRGLRVRCARSPLPLRRTRREGERRRGEGGSRAALIRCWIGYRGFERRGRRGAGVGARVGAGSSVFVCVCVCGVMLCHSVGGI